MRAPSARCVSERLWQSRVRCGRALPRSALRRVVGHFGVFSFRFEQRTSQEAKYRFMHAFMPHLIALKQEREVILCGDINIAHKEIDLKNWRSNQKHSGFLP